MVYKYIESMKVMGMGIVFQGDSAEVEGIYLYVCMYLIGLSSFIHILYFSILP